MSPLLPPLEEEPVTDPESVLDPKRWDGPPTRRVPPLDRALPWFVLDDVDIRWGPLSFSQLSERVQRGHVYRTTRVWQDGMAGWTPAGEVVQLLPLWSRFPVPEPLSEEPFTQLAMTPSSLELLRRTGDEHTEVIPLLTPGPAPELPRWPVRVERTLDRRPRRVWLLWGVGLLLLLGLTALGLSRRAPSTPSGSAAPAVGR